MSLLLLLAWFLLPSVSALVTTHHILYSNRRWIPLGQFDFQSNGGVEVNASDVILFLPDRSSPADTSSIGFLLAEAADAAWIESQSRDGPQSPDTGLVCPLTSPNVTVLFRVHDMAAAGEGGKRPPKYTSAAVPRAGLHTLFLVNCGSSSLISATVQVGMWNTGPADAKLYLPPGQFYLAILELAVSGLFVLLTGWWLLHVLKVWCQAVAPPGYQVLLTLALPLLAAVSLCSGMCLLVRQAYGFSPAWDTLTDWLVLSSTGLLVAAFLSGIEQVDTYLSDLERIVVYIAIPQWLISQAGLVMSSNSGLLAQIVPPDGPLWQPMLEQLQAGVLLALGMLTILVLIQLLGYCCSLALLKRGGRQAHRDDRVEDSPMSKFYVHLSMCIIGTSALAYLLRRYLPFSLTWLADALCLFSFFGLMAYTMNKVRPRLEKSVYQLFDENDDMDEELAEL